MVNIDVLLLKHRCIVGIPNVCQCICQIPEKRIHKKMLTSTFFGLRAASASVMVTRNLAAAQKAIDPIQQLFLDKIREYKQKSAGGKLVDPSPAIQKELKAEFEKLEKQYGGGSGVDMTAFPSFKFEEPKLDPIDEQAPKK